MSNPRINVNIGDLSPEDWNDIRQEVDRMNQVSGLHSFREQFLTRLKPEAKTVIISTPNKRHDSPLEELYRERPSPMFERPRHWYNEETAVHALDAAIKSGAVDTGLVILSLSEARTLRSYITRLQEIVAQVRVNY